MAKQCWRLFYDSDSLPSQILRAKYYNGGSFLEAHLGLKPSFAWRSIHGAIDLFQGGLFWRIGNGATVGIWGERWVPIPDTFIVQTQPNGLPATARVKELFDFDTNWLDFQRLRKNFNLEEVRAISGMDYPDRLVWRGTDSGEFTIRSAYHLAKEKEDWSSLGCSRRAEESEIWWILWQLQMPNSDKNFL